MTSPIPIELKMWLQGWEKCVRTGNGYVKKSYKKTLIDTFHPFILIAYCTLSLNSPRMKDLVSPSEIRLMTFLLLNINFPPNPHPLVTVRPIRVA
jgi:hypothetical protein